MKKQKYGILISVLVILLVSLACGLPASVPVTPTPTTGIISPTATNAPQATATEEVALPTHTAEPTQPDLPTVSEITFYLVGLEDQGQSGIPVGCGDSLVPVTQPVNPTSEPIRTALERLFSFDTEFVGESGLYNVLWQSDLSVESAVVGSDGVARVALTGTYLLGGVCDNPRFQGQIEQTILTSSPDANTIEVTINGVPLAEIVSGQ